MTKSRPFLLIVISALMLLVIMVAFWFALLPQRLKVNVIETLKQDHGLQVQARQSSLSFSDGPQIVLEDVTIGKENSAIVAEQVAVRMGFSAFLSGRPTLQDIVFTKPVVDVDISEGNTLPTFAIQSAELREATLRLRDQKHQSTITLSNVNGTITKTENGGLNIKATLLAGAGIATLTFEADSATRLFTDGSPTDATLIGGGNVLAFSGRTALSNGLALNGNLTAEAEQMSAMTAMLGLPTLMFNDAGNFRLQSGLSTQGLHADLAKFEALTVNTKASGTIALTAEPDRTKLSGEAFINGVTLEPGFDFQNLGQAWSEKPLPWADAFRADYDLNFKFLGLRLDSILVPEATLNVKHDGERATLMLASDDFAQSKAAIRFGMSSLRTNPKVSLSLDVKGLSAASLGASDGALDVVANVEGQGASLAQLISSLAGTASLNSENIKFTGLDPSLLLSTFGDGWRVSSDTTEQTATFTMAGNLRDGILTLQDSNIKTGAVTLAPTGQIDLLRRAFNVLVKPKGGATDSKMALQQ
jgi:hypothetical protein